MWPLPSCIYPPQKKKTCASQPPQARTDPRPQLSLCASPPPGRTGPQPWPSAVQGPTSNTRAKGLPPLGNLKLSPKGPVCLCSSLWPSQDAREGDCGGGGGGGG